MSKLNKIFLAIIVALLVTAIAEVIFIFVYKQPQTVTTPTTTEATPAPFSKEISPEYMQALANWPHFRNATLSMTETVTGSISAIIKQSPTSLFTIQLYGTRGLDTIRFDFPPYAYEKISVYSLDRLTGNTTKINIDDLKPEDEIQMNLIKDLNSDLAHADRGTIIYKVKK